MPLNLSRGFTLTELAVVLAIVALLIGGMLMPLALQDELRRVEETERTLKETKEALTGFAAATGRLPRPAAGATDGSEKGVCGSDLDCTGFIPWSLLGTNKTDGWGKLIRYSVTPAFANAPVTLATVANRKVLSRDGAGAIVYLAGQAAACNATTNLCTPAVVYSHGKRNWGTTDSGLGLGDSSLTNVDEDANENGPTDYFSRILSENAAATGGEFDDIMQWISVNILFNRLISAGRLP